MPDTNEMCSRVLERFLAASSGLCRLPVGNGVGFTCSLGRSRAGLLLCAGQEQLSYSHQPQGGGQHHTDPRKEGSTVLTAEWPIAGLIPLGVENVTPRSTKPLALQRQIPPPTLHWSIHEVGNPWVLLQQPHIFKPRLTSGTSKGSCQDMSPAFMFTCVHWGCSCCIWLGGLRAQDSLHRSEASRLCRVRAMGRFSLPFLILLWELAGILQSEAIIFLGRSEVIPNRSLE